MPQHLMAYTGTSTTRNALDQWLRANLGAWAPLPTMRNNMLIWR